MSATTLKYPIYEHIRAKLLAGEYPVGQRISELAIAKDLGVSRAPVREAIHQLAGEELVELVPGLGAFAKLPTRQELAELFDLREAIETHAAARAAKRITPRQLAALEAANRARYRVLRRMKDQGRRDPDEDDAILILTADARFHRTILKASGNPRIARLVADLSLLARVWSRRLDPELFDVFAEVVRAYVFHRRITAALRRRDARSARYWMRRHLRATYADYLKQMRVSGHKDLAWSPRVLQAVLEAVSRRGGGPDRG